jgi:hypothetical protein
MGMGNGSPIDSQAIDESVERMYRQLDAGVVDVRYRYRKNEAFKARNGANPREARVTVTPGIHQQGGYFDIQWWENGDYKYHYRERGLQFRFGREQANRSTANPVRHFHPPDNIDAHHPSCIEPGLHPDTVTIGVLKTWWAAVQHNDASLVNAQNGLP